MSATAQRALSKYFLLLLLNLSVEVGALGFCRNTELNVKMIFGTSVSPSSSLGWHISLLMLWGTIWRIFFFLILHLLILNQESGMHCKVVGLIADDWAVTQAAVLWGVVSMVHLTFYASRWISWLCALKIEYNILKGVNHPDITCQYQITLCFETDLCVPADFIAGCLITPLFSSVSLLALSQQPTLIFFHFYD